MKNKNLLLVLLTLLSVGGLGYLALNPLRDDSFPSIPFDVKWDIREKDSNITTGFSVSDNTDYAFMISFRIMDSAKDVTKLRSELSEIVGYIYYPTGTAIPIHVKVETSGERTVFDKTVSTKGTFRQGSLNIDREMVSIHLIPGKYIVTVTTTEATPLPDGIETYFSIGTHFHG